MAGRSAPIAGRLLEMVRLDPGNRPPVLDREAVETLVPLANFEGVASWFRHRVIETGQDSDSPAALQLRTLVLNETARSLKLYAATVQVLELFTRQNIRVIPLKGIAYAALGSRFPYLRFRSTGDIDLLVEPGSARRAWQLLVDAGFRRTETPSVHPDHHHHPTLVGDLEVPVEIHASASLFWSDSFSWQRLGEGARQLTWQGRPLEVPSTTELCWHALIHSLGDGASGCRLRGFLTVGALLRDEAIDWELLGSRLENERVREHDSRHLVPVRAARRWLGVAAWLAGIESPEGIASGSAIPDLIPLLEFRRQRISRRPETTAAQARTASWMEEGTRAALGLGLRRLGHWHPKRFRPKQLVASLFYQSAYRINVFGARSRNP